MTDLSNQNPQTVPCDGCRTPITRQWLLGPNWCQHFADIARHVDRIITWRADPDYGRETAHPLQALTDLHIARVTANRLIRQVVADACDRGATWEEIGEHLHLDPRDAAARYRQNGGE